MSDKLILEKINEPEITYSKFHRGFRINTNEEKGEGCFVKILEDYQSRLSFMLMMHSKVLQFRFDLHYPDDSNFQAKNSDIYHFNDYLRRKLLRKTRIGSRNSLAPMIITVREQSGSVHPHFHCVQLVNGNAIKDAYHLMEKNVEPTWWAVLKTKSKGLVHFCNEGGRYGLMIIRGHPDMEAQIQEASYQASYLAKIRTKELNPKGNWLTKGTRLPRSIFLPQTITALIYAVTGRKEENHDNE